MERHVVKAGVTTLSYMIKRGEIRVPLPNTNGKRLYELIDIFTKYKTVVGNETAVKVCNGVIAGLKYVAATRPITRAYVKSLEEENTKLRGAV